LLKILDVSYDQLWFTQNGNDLTISITGTTDNVTIQNWYASDTYKVETIETATHTLDHTAVAQLIQAMPAFNPPAGNISDDPNLSASLTDTLQNTWQTKTA
jgi:hypothetical protein